MCMPHNLNIIQAPRRHLSDVFRGDDVGSRASYWVPIVSMTIVSYHAPMHADPRSPPKQLLLCCPAIRGGARTYYKHMLPLVLPHYVYIKSYYIVVLGYCMFMVQVSRQKLLGPVVVSSSQARTMPLYVFQRMFQ